MSESEVDILDICASMHCIALSEETMWVFSKTDFSIGKP